MPTPFDTLSADDARKKIALPDDAGAAYTANQKYYDGDHWQDGAGWIGPGAGDTGILPDIQRAFVSKNVVREVAERHMAGVVGIEPRWALAVRRPLADDEQPSTQEQALIDEAEALLTEWWDARRGHLLLQEAATRLALAPRAVLRLYVPAGNIEQPTDTSAEPAGVPVSPAKQSLDRIYLTLPDVAQAGVAVDADTQQPIGVYSYEDANQKAITELAYRDGDTTVLRVIGKEGEAGYTLAFSGQLPLYQLDRQPLITAQVRQQQAALNMAKTMQSRNVVLGGFLERVILNASPPGQKKVDPATGEETFVPLPIKTGAGTTNFFSGAVYTDNEGNIHVLNPSVVYRDPVDIKTFLDSTDSEYRGILEETRQIHAIQTGAFNISGESRKQARADFKTSLLPTKAELDRAGRWLLETLLAMASAFSGEPGRFAELRASFDCILDLGPMPADEQGQIISQVDKKLRSRASGMTALGIADPDAEMAAIAAEDEAADQRETRNGSALLAKAGLLAQDATQQPTEAQGATEILAQAQEGDKE